MKVYYIGQHENCLKKLTDWAKLRSCELFDASVQQPPEKAMLFILEDAAKTINRDPLFQREDLAAYYLIEKDFVGMHLKNRRIPVVFTQVDLAFQIDGGNFFDYSALTSFGSVDIKNMVSLPIYSKESYELFRDFTSYIRNAVGCSRVTMAVLFPNNRYGVVLSSADNLAFKNYVLFLENYPELAEVIKKRDIVSFSRDELVAMNVDLAASDTMKKVVVLPLFNSNNEVSAAIILKSENDYFAPDIRTCEIIQHIFTTFISRIFLFENAGNNVGGCPFLIGSDAEDSCWASLDFIPEGMMITDKSGRIEFINKYFEQILNLEKKAFLKKNAQNIFEINIEQVEQDSEYYHFFSLTKKNLNWRRFDLSSSRYGYIVKEKNEQSFSAKDVVGRLRSSIDACRPFIVFDILGVIKAINSDAANLIGDTVESLEEHGNIVRFVSDPECIARLMNHAKGYTGNLYNIPVACSMIDVDGNPIIAKVRVSYSKHQELFIFEITSQAIDEIDEISHKLTDIVKGETDINTLFEKFAGMISHNFNQRFSVIRMCLDMIDQRRQTDPETIKYIARIREEIIKSTDLVKDISAINFNESINYIGNTQILDIKKRNDEK